MTALPYAAPVRVVIVDDTPDLRELLRFALEQQEFTVVAEAGDGRRGVEVVEEMQPDVVLLDLAMPVMDGFEALPRMRRLCPRAKIIVLSGFDAGAMSARAHDLGADGYLQKGASLSATLGYVREVVGPLEPALPVTAPAAHASPAATPALTVVPEPGATAPETALETAPETGPQTHADAGPETHVDSGRSSTGAIPGITPLPRWAHSAPCGVVVVREVGLVVREANPAAARMLGSPVSASVPLAVSQPRLADLLREHLEQGRVADPGSAPEQQGSARLVLVDDAATIEVVVTREPDTLVVVLGPRGHARA